MVQYPLPDNLEQQRKESKPPYRLAKLVEDRVIESDYSRSEKPPQVFSPSAVGYCKRQMYNRKMNLTDMDRYIQGILHAGTVNHFWLEHNLPELANDRTMMTERKFRKEIPVEDEDFNVYVSGYADVTDGEGYVYDHKFTGDPTWKKDKPALKDELQVMMYLYCLDDIHTGRLEYNKRDGKHPETEENTVYHTIKFDKQKFDNVMENMVEVAKAVKNRKGTDLQYMNPFDRCSRDGGDPCFYCEDDHKDTRKEVSKTLSDKEVWSKWKEGEGITTEDLEQQQKETEKQASESSQEQ